ncbi:MAG: acyl carrier protein [Verrucomicrobia bacterium]|nr:acyl carrier protein [Verrucomicrobiota bacterium]
MNIESKIKEYIATNLLFSPEGFAYPDDASFLKEGIIDSIGVMELVSFVQSTFKIEVNQAEVTPDNFDSVARLAAFVRRKQPAAGVAAA